MTEKELIERFTAYRKRKQELIQALSVARLTVGEDINNILSDCEIEDLKGQKQELEELIKMADIRYRAVLYGFYIKGLTNREISEELGYHLRSVFKIKKKGFRSIIENMGGKR